MEPKRLLLSGERPWVLPGGATPRPGCEERERRMEPTWPDRGEQRGHPRSWFWTSSTILAAAADAAANAGSLGPLGLPSPPRFPGTASSFQWVHLRPGHRLSPGRAPTPKVCLRNFHLCLLGPGGFQGRPALPGRPQVSGTERRGIGMKRSRGSRGGRRRVWRWWS